MSNELTKGGNMGDYEKGWKRVDRYLDQLLKTSRNEIASKIINNIIVYRNKVEDYENKNDHWLTTREICDKYNISRQVLHLSDITPDRTHPRKILWNDFDVKVWRNGIEEKKERVKERKYQEAKKLEWKRKW